MRWIPTAIALWSLIVASIALWNSRAAQNRLAGISAGLARISGKLSAMEAATATVQPLTSSQLAELAAVRDAIDKGNALLKRIASREAMRDRRESSDPTNVEPGALKAYLRRKAGLVAGRPANHFEDRQ